MIAYLADDRAADGGNIHAVLDCNVQVDVDTAVHSLGDLYAARLVFASEQMRQPDFLPDAFESGTPNVPGIAGLAAGAALVRSVGPERILAHERQLIAELARALEREPRIECFT